MSDQQPALPEKPHQAAEELWGQILQSVQPPLDEEELATYVAPLHPLLKGSALVLFASNEHIVDHIRANLLRRLGVPAKAHGVELQYVVGNRPKPGAAKPKAVAENSHAEKKGPPSSKSPERKKSSSARREGSLPVSWGDSARGFPTDFARCALFSARQFGEDEVRPFHERKLLPGQQGAQIRVTGEQLSMFDRRVWAQVLQYQRNHKLAEGFWFSARQILQDAGLAVDGRSVSKLKAALLRLRRTVLEVSRNTSDGRQTYFKELNMLDEFEIDDTRGAASWYVRMSPQIAEQLADNVTLINHELSKRLRKPLASWLLLYYSSHRAPYEVLVETLRLWSDSGHQPMKEFRRHLKEALKMLMEGDDALLEQAEIRGDKVYVKRRGIGGAKLIDHGI